MELFYKKKKIIECLCKLKGNTEIWDWTSSYLLRFQMIILVPFFPIIASSSASNFSSVENKECVKMAFRLFLDSVGSLIWRKHYVKESNFEWSKLSEGEETSATVSCSHFTGSHSTSQSFNKFKGFNKLQPSLHLTIDLGYP